MGTIRQGNGQVVILMTLAGCLLLFCAFFVSYETSSPAVSVDETLLIQGVVRRVLPGKKMIFVKVTRGESIKILVCRQTGFVGTVSLKELERGQWVKVWYNSAGGENRAVKVEKLPDLGC